MIRRATPDDVPAVAALVESAFARYVERMGLRPRPMDDDHAARVAAGQQWVLEDDGALVGAIVLVAGDDHLLVDNLAVAPDRQGAGLGRALLGQAEGEARRLGLPELRLYTNAAMTENLVFYPRQGFVETDRATVGRFHRVFYVKRLPEGPVPS